jgi:hypothetical protein
MENKKVFSSAPLGKFLFQGYAFLIIIVLFLQITGGANIQSMLLNLLFGVIGYLVLVRVLVVKIITDNTGITYTFLFTKIQASWNEIISVKQFSFFYLSIELE